MGRQVDVLVDGPAQRRPQWLELAECGLIAPHVLQDSGLDPECWSGLALGLGLDRAVMLRKQIPDIRYLRSAEPRIAAQLADLAPWRPVSMLPPVTRDLSVVIESGTAEESIGDTIRNSLGDAVDDIESIELRSRTSYAELPPAARERLGLTDQQENVLIRLVLRPLQHTLTDEQANAIRNQVYRAIHRGPYLELA
jgi:phenylalanyl-tRNA synthetase alpha chain